MVEIEEDTIGMPMGTVSFGGVTKRVCFAYTPEAAVGDYVVVHVGFAISRIDEQQACQTWAYLEEMGELGELEVSQPGAAGQGVAAGEAGAAADRPGGGGRPGGAS